MDRLLVRRNRQSRDLRPIVSAGRRQMADFEQRRIVCAMAPGREGTVLHGFGEFGEDGFRRSHCHRGHAGILRPSSTVRLRIHRSCLHPHGQLEHLRRFRRRPAIPHPPARIQSHRRAHQYTDHGGPQLDGGAKEMTLTAGTQLGPYKLLGPIGAGGMGEVYRAHDTKLGRDVAIKVLPEIFAHDPERLARFQREAEMLAALNHPNIATIFGLEQANGTSYLVMELVSGETLADHVKREGAFPVEESLAIAKQIAEALEAAHEKGIIHRDLKPANVKVTPEGKVKVLDFGLAKAFAGDLANEDIGNSPTLSQAATMQGVILGTAAYMSPEQARGKTVDKRTDIWAFGCVLYELLTGKQ